MLFNFKFKSFYFALLLLASFSFAQTGIGTSTPHASAKLEVASATQGFLPPRVALTATNATSPVTLPATGLMVYNTTSNASVTPGYYFWNGSLWVRLIVPTDNATNVTGTVAVANGGTGATTATGTGSVVLSNTPTIEMPTISSGNTQFPTSINVLPSTHATSRQASVWIGDWGLLQDFNGNGTRNFSITQNLNLSYPSRFFINTNGNVGIGNSAPTETLEVSGNVKAINFLGTATSAKLYLLEAYAQDSYTLLGAFTKDICRYSVVNTTANVPSSWFNTSNHRFTPLKAGYWEIRASYDVYRNGEAALIINKNEVTVSQISTISSVQLTISKIIYLNGLTDYINIYNIGFNSNLRSQVPSVSWFQARWVGE